MPSFVDAVAAVDAARWEQFEPLYRQLVERPLRCVGCLETLILDRSQLDARVSEAGADLYIEMTCHTDDPARQARYRDFVEEVEPKIAPLSAALDRRIAESPFASQLPRERHEVLLRDLRLEIELYREENIPLLTELTMLDQRYSQIAGAQTVQFDGQERTLAQMARFVEENDRAVRESAWRAIAQRRFADREAIDGIYDEMLARRQQVAANAGFANFRDYQHRRMHRFDYAPADCERFHGAAERSIVPLARRLDERRRAALGLSALRPWDLAVDPQGRPPLRPFDGAEALVAGSSRIFHRLRPSLGAMFDALRSGGCLDLESRKGKAPGGYQYQRQWSRRPFIFMNAAGVQRDVTTMVHEAGHAFHSTLSREDPILAYRSAPLEFSEVASMSMELLTLDLLEEFHAPDEAARAIRQLLEEIPGRLAWIAQVDAFQHWTHLTIGHGREARADAWEQLDRRFGHEIDWTGLEPLRRRVWQRQLHLFGLPFYYIEYAIAQLGALQLWSAYRRDPEGALAAYERSLALGGSRPLPELFAAAGIRFDFGGPIVGELMDELAEAIESLPAPATIS